MDVSAAPHLLDAFPMSRATTVRDACELVGRSFSPHRLELRDAERALALCHNQVRFRDASLNTLSYGADVLIDPGERGDFYMVQLPLAGSGTLHGADGADVRMDDATLTVLQPRERCRMLWRGDCRMILVQVPRDAVERRMDDAAPHGQRRFATAHPRGEPEVAAWWQAVLDLTCNLDRFGEQWLRHPAAYAAMEEFLLAGLTSLLGRPGAAAPARGAGEARCLRRAKEFIHARLGAALTLAEIAEHACVSPRTLEAAFRRSGEPSPLAYARQARLAAVHERLRAAALDGRAANVTDVAMEHGFIHMGRFAAQYRQRYGCSPSQTLRAH